MYLYDRGIAIFLVDEIYTCQYKITNSTATSPNMHKYYCANPYSVSRKAVKNYTSHCYTSKAPNVLLVPQFLLQFRASRGL